jgi:hypothetical protein
LLFFSFDMDDVQILDDLSAEPALHQVYTRMGFKPRRAEIPVSMRNLVEEVLQLGRELVRPRAIFRRCAIIRADQDGIELEAGLRITSLKVRHRMEGCPLLYLTAVTLGPDLDQRVAELSSGGDVTRAFLLNAYGAEAAEALMESLDAHIAQLESQRGFSTTKRYSPGYGDWRITAQKELLEQLEADRIGIRLMDSFLMIPEKSVSAIIGARPISITTRSA